MTGDRPAPLLVAHRGASGYAPEHTIAAYELAIEQGADIIEPDLQVTSDGRLIALHDLTLERTTNVREVFPDRFREETDRGQVVRRWYANDFTLEEIRRLDAGSWFGQRFAGARVPTLAEVIEVARGRAGIFPETKAPEVYGERGHDMERLLLDELRAHGLDRQGADPATPVYLQSFSPESLRVLRHELGLDLHLTFLISGGLGALEWLTPEGLARVRAFADGIGPSKSILLERPDVVSRAHEAGLTVIPYTFRADDSGDFPTAAAEMAYFLYDLGVDGLFTNEPNLFPRTPPGAGS
jgi:glycerophosphoryl diester phosphodiesterase